MLATLARARERSGRDGPVMASSTGNCGKPGTGCDVMYHTAWSTSVACRRLWSTTRTSHYCSHQ